MPIPSSFKGSHRCLGRNRSFKKSTSNSVGVSIFRRNRRPSAPTYPISPPPPTPRPPYITSPATAVGGPTAVTPPLPLLVANLAVKRWCNGAELALANSSAGEVKGKVLTLRFLTLALFSLGEERLLEETENYFIIYGYSY